MSSKYSDKAHVLLLRTTGEYDKVKDVLKDFPAVKAEIAGGI